jgi:hypothetical protein
MADISTYGVVLSVGDGATPTETFTAIAGLISLEPPEIMQEKVEVTNHGSLGKKQFIYGGLVEFGEFKCKISYFDASTLRTACVSGIVHNYQIGFPGDGSWEFSALVTSFKPTGMDAQKPEQFTAEVAFQPSGEMTILDA